jgi:ABC-type multidrug transport system fused ATPase/permease subunit
MINRLISENFVRYLRIAYVWLRSRLFLLMLLNVVAAGIEGVGILLFLPFLARAGVAPPATDAPSFLPALLNEWAVRLTLVETLLLLVGIFLLKGLLVFITQVYRSMLLNKLELDLREDLVRAFGGLDYRYATTRSTGHFSHLVVHETQAVRGAIDALCILLGAVVTTGMLVVAALMLDPELSLFIVVSSGLSLLLLRKLSRLARYHSSTITELEGRLNAFLIEALQAFRYLKATHRFHILDRRLLGTSGETRRERNRLDRMLALHNAAQEPLLVILIAVMFYGSVQFLGRAVSTVFVSLAIFYRCMIEMRLIQNQWQVLSARAGGLEAVWQALGDMRAHQENTAGDGEIAADLSIRLENVSFAYEQEPVLKNLSINLPMNHTVAVVGASGAGKTTLIGLLTGLFAPATGRLTVGERPLRELDLAAYRRTIGYVPQEPIIFSGSVAENINLCPGGPGQEQRDRMLDAARRAHCHAFIEKLPHGYDTLLGERGATLSGGQRQRLAIARELFRSPRLLILDEAASALDSGSEQVIRESLDELKGSVTIVVISHRLSAVRNADAIYVLDGGRVEASGSFDELAQESPLFRRMCEQQHLL